MAEKKEEKESWGKFFLDILIIWGILFGVYMLLFHFVLSNDTVSGPSMQPTFQNGDRLIAERHAQIKRGEVVIVKAPDEPGALYIKRVIGLPGEKIVSKKAKITDNLIPYNIRAEISLPSSSVPKICRLSGGAVAEEPNIPYDADGTSVKA